MPKTRLCIIRHGETDWNQEKRIQGQLDIPLNDAGRAQAIALASDTAMFESPFTAIYSSDLSRAYETALVLASRCGQKVNTLADLRERHYGIFQGVIKDEAEHINPAAFELYNSRDVDFNFETGEALTDFSRRTLDTFERIVQQHHGETVAIVCHAGLLDIMYRITQGEPLHTPRTFDIPNCALNWFHHDGKRWNLDAWDDHHYLNKVLLDSVE